MNKQTVTISLLRTIIENYPVIPSHMIHHAGREGACLSGGQRLRELKKVGVMYSYKEHKYDFSQTEPLILWSILKEKEGK